MKYYLLLFLLLIPKQFCVLRKKSSSLSHLKGNDDKKFQGYSKEAFTKINEYRQKEFQSKNMQWNDKLGQSATQEAKSIIAEKRFGSHDKFGKWENAILNDYFTEIAVKMVWNNKKLPDKKTFAKDVVIALIQQDTFYVVQEYSTAGVGMEQIPKTNEYVIVVHLAEISKKYSCKDSLDAGEKAAQVAVLKKGDEVFLKCDQQTEGGGWTLITDVNEYARGTRTIIPIDDYGLSYKEIMFEAKPYFYFNYVSGRQNVWDFDQYNFRQCTLRFGDSWYADKRHQNYKIKYINYDRTTDIKILEKGKKCFYGSGNDKNDCAKKFIFKKIPAGRRVDGFSEMESAANVAFTDNIYRFYFKLYVR